jgi:hypothetical protein
MACVGVDLTVFVLREYGGTLPLDFSYQVSLPSLMTS